MAVILYRCTDCDREIQLIEKAQGLETIGRCIITNKCRGDLYRVNRFEDYAVSRFPDDVSGLTNWIQRRVLYNHTQAIADTTWTVTHNLGVNPSVEVVVDRETVVDGVVTTSQIEIQPETVTIVDENTLRLTFDRPESGLAQVIARSTRSTQIVEEADPGITYLPVTVDGILTLAIDCESGQFPATSATENTVRIYFLDQEELDATALDSAVFKDYPATTSLDTTSPWSDASEIFVNGDIYTVVTIDIGDPVNDFGAPSAGTVLFQFGTATSGFPYDQAPNMVVLLSNEPHLNADKNRRRLFRPELEVGPTLSLDSFIFANGEIVVDQAVTEEPFPPIYLVDAPQDCGYVAPAEPVVPADPGFIMALTQAYSFEADPGYQITSDDDITSWTLEPMPGGPISFPWNPDDLTYASTAAVWVGVSQDGEFASPVTKGQILYSDDDGGFWKAPTQPLPIATSVGVNCIDVGEVSGVETIVALTNSTGGGMGVVYSTDGINWSLGNGGASVIPGGNGRKIRWTGDRWIAIDSAGRYWSLTDPTAAWPAASGTALPDTGVTQLACALHSTNTSRVLFGCDTGAKIFYSDNDGASWSTPTFSNPIYSPSGDSVANISNISGFADDGNGTVIAVGSNFIFGSPRIGYYFLSTDNGASWTQTMLPINGGIANAVGTDVVYDPDYGFVVVGRANSSGPNYDIVVATSPDGTDGSWTTRLTELTSVSGGQPFPVAVTSKSNNLIT